MANQVWNRLNQATTNYQAAKNPTINTRQSFNEMYPGLNENSYNKMVSAVDSLGLTGDARTNAMNNYYRNNVKFLVNDQLLDERDDYINEQAYEAAQLHNTSADAQLKMTEASQRAKKLWNLDAKANDMDVFSAMVDTLGENGMDLAGKYLSGESDEFLVAAGLKPSDAQKWADEYNIKRSNINNALINNWRELSNDGLKYVRNYNVMFQLVDLARQDGLGEGMTDEELLKGLVEASPELQDMVMEMDTLKLDNEDKAILGEAESELSKEWNQAKNNFRNFVGWNSTNPATLDDIEEEIYVRENSKGETGKNFKANLRNGGDSIEKFAYRVPKDLQNWAANTEMKLNKDMSDETRNSLSNEISENIKKVQAYNESLDKEAQASKDKIGLDPIIQNYYNKQGITESLFNDNLGGAGYKMAGDAAGNRDMLLGMGASVVNPVLGLAVMGTDTFARENQESFESLIKAQTDQGVSYEDAYNNASKGAAVVGLINTAIELGLEKTLGGVETTTAKNIKSMFTNNLNKEVTQMVAERGIADLLAQGLTTQARSSLEEGLEEIFQQLTQNIAVSQYDPDQKISEGIWEAFEGGALNPMNILAGGSEVLSNVDKESLYNGAYNAGNFTRGVVDTLNPQDILNNIKKSALEGAYKAGETTRNISDTIGTTKLYENIRNKDNGTQIGNEVQTEEVEVTNNKGDKTTLKEELYSIDPTLKKNLQNNPYSAEVWQRTKDYIDKNGRPERSNDVAKALIVDVADKVQEKLVEKMEEGGKNGKLYQTIDNAGFTVDLTELKDGLDEILEGYGIEIEDGKLNFDKTAIDGSEASNIRKIYNWLQNTNAPMSEKEFRTRFKQAMKDMVDFNPNNKDQAGRRKSDTPGDKVIKGIMKKANDLAHAQIPELAELDKIYSEWVDIMDEVSDGLVYKDAAKRGIIKDNVYQIIKNLDEPSRRQMVNRLEKLIPGIKEEVNAINQMPKVIDHYYNPSKLQQGLTSEGVKTVGTIGGLPGYLLAKWGGEGIAKIIDSHKSKAWDEVLQETSEEGKAKMQEIQTKIEENKRLTKEQEARLQGLKDRLMEKMATVEKTDAEQSAWESYLADLEQDEVIDMPEEMYDQWEEAVENPKTKKKTKKKTTKKTEGFQK